METKIIDIYSTGEYPANVLSNFYPNGFVFDGVACASMEGLLQSLKTKNAALQEKVCALSGKQAKFAFRHKFQNVRWKLTGKLYWKGCPIDRHSDGYQVFLDNAYLALSGNDIFAAALKSTCGATLTHKIGKRDRRKTILTEYEFLSRLKMCRQLTEESSV